MDTQLLTLFSMLLTSTILVYLWLWRKKKYATIFLLPGPPAWPIVGNLFQMGETPNESLFSLSQQYGPLMTLRLGMKATVVVSSSAMAKEVLKTQDQVFAGQPIMAMGKVHDQGKSAMGLLE
ncbi:hypothetical protein SUGI_0645410 [Cryptomeria japonica]|uniref:cytochrome P450 76T24-like n=1 Tax=Cryptomeria japonica TaxID=3369 RepID=UPI002414980E|nr:cytochrome P450 76T24-like [Cryptomeria japonica]GLJ32051.1 hypothetical protein SUGI_0645410 [Cryptomeria japonica]